MSDRGRENGERRYSVRRVEDESEARSLIREVDRRIKENEALAVIERAKVVVLADKMLIVKHTLEGDGVKGLSERVHDLEVLQVSTVLTPREQKEARYRALQTATGILGMIATALGILFLLAGKLVWK